MRVRRLTAAVASAAAAVAFSVGPWAAPASAKDFSVPLVEIDATLRPDGAMQVVEHLTYDFNGSFSNGTRPIPPGETYRIVEMSVSENGRPLPFDGAPHNLAWHYSATDERRTFDISYTVLGAAQAGSDIAELYWKWIGDGDHPPVGAVRVSLTVPGTGEGVRAWAHGPLNGKVEARGNLVLFEVDGVGHNQFVEGRVAVPVAAMSVPPGPTPRLPAVLAEEEAYAAEANRIREERRLRTERVNRWYPVVPVLGWIGFLFIWFRWGKEHATPEREYVREPPDDPPAVVAALQQFGSVPPVAFAATVVDLAQRGHLTITEERTDRLLLADKIDWRFARTPDGGDELRAWESAIVDRLFADGETTAEEFATWGRDHPGEGKKFWDDFVASVKSELDERGYLERNKFGPMGLNVVVALGVVALGVVAVANGALIGLIGIPSGVVQLLFTKFLQRRTPAGANRSEEWSALKRFLEHFSQLDEAPIGHLVLYERYLVYAVALEVSEEVAQGLAMRVPQPAAGGTYTHPLWYVGSGSRGFGSLASFGAFGSTVRAAMVPAQSSSSGGGGGFSGGGGGGGGGGGFGAS